MVEVGRSRFALRERQFPLNSPKTALFPFRQMCYTKVGTGRGWRETSIPYRRLA